MREGMDAVGKWAGLSQQHPAYLPNRANEVQCRKICKIRIYVGRKLFLSGHLLAISVNFDQIHYRGVIVLYWFLVVFFSQNANSLHFSDISFKKKCWWLGWRSLWTSVCCWVLTLKERMHNKMFETLKSLLSGWEVLRLSESIFICRHKVYFFFSPLLIFLLLSHPYWPSISSTLLFPQINSP